MLQTSVNSLQIYNSSQFQNTATGVYDFQSDGGMLLVNTSTLTNNGLIRKTAGAGTSYISTPYGSKYVNSGGTVDIETGTLGVPGLTLTGILQGYGALQSSVVNSSDSVHHPAS